MQRALSAIDCAIVIQIIRPTAAESTILPTVLKCCLVKDKVFSHFAIKNSNDSL